MSEHQARCDWCLAHVPIIWAITDARKKMPIEAAPDPAGNAELTFHPNPKVPPHVTVHKGPPGMFDDWTAYMPHHARCDRDTPKALARTQFDQLKKEATT